MFKWLIEWRKQGIFNSAFEKACDEKYKDGTLSYEDYVKSIKASKNPEAMKRARRQMMADPNMLGGISDWDWQAIFKWFMDYIVPALRIIIPILLILEPNPTPDDE